MAFSRYGAARLLAIGITACEDGADPPAPMDRSAHSIEISPDELLLELTETYPVTATVRDAAGLPIEDAADSWRMDEPTVASVTGSGLVEPLGRTTGLRPA